MPTLLSSYVVSQFVIKPRSGSKLTVRYRFFYRVDRIFFVGFVKNAEQCRLNRRPLQQTIATVCDVENIEHW